MTSPYSSAPARPAVEREAPAIASPLHRAAGVQLPHHFALTYLAPDPRHFARPVGRWATAAEAEDVRVECVDCAVMEVVERPGSVGGRAA